MCSSPASPDDSRTIRNIFHIFHKRIATALYRKYVSAGLGTDVFGPKIVASLWAGLLLFVAIAELLPGDSVPMTAVSNINDKVLHVSTYAVVAFLPAFGLRISTAVSCVIATELVGIGLDLAQGFVRQRSYDPYDIVANTVGVIIGIVVAVAGRSRVVRTGYFSR
jgi:VanZ family protein